MQEVKTQELTAGARGGLAVFPRGARWAARGVCVAAVLLASVHALMTVGHVVGPPFERPALRPVQRAWMLPEFEQGWRLYAPDPGMSRELVQARVRVAGVRGTVTSRWIDVTALHRKAVRGRLFLGHAELERMNAAVDLYDGFTGPAGRPQGWQGRWAQRHLCRALLPWLAPYAPPGRITQMQVRMLTSHLPAPPWQTASHDRGGRRAVPAVREVSRWLTVRPEDRKVSR